jgi:signal transduction histidine kinase
MVLMDSNRFKQVMLNLITNAIKFTRDGEIKIKCFGFPIIKPEKLLFEVEDSGIGIP